MTKRLSKMHRRRWAVYCNALKRRYPLPYPVRIVTRHIDDRYNGDANLVKHGRKTYYRIQIHNANVYSRRLDALIHEYAHCCATLSWHSLDVDGLDRISDHDEVYVIWQARCHRLVVDTYAALPDELKDKADRGT